MSSVLSLPEQVSTDLAATVKKPVARVEGISPYSEVRKSYRKIHRLSLIHI